VGSSVSGGSEQYQSPRPPRLHARMAGGRAAMCSLPGAHCRDLLSRVAALSVRRVQRAFGRGSSNRPPILFRVRSCLAACGVGGLRDLRHCRHRLIWRSGSSPFWQGSWPARRSAASLGRVWRKIATDSCRGADLILIFHRHQLHPGYNKGSGA
jgi:hypothetical protein